MNKKLGTVILILIIAAIAWFAYAQSQKVASDSQAAPEFTMEASFICDDSTYFIAAFPETEDVSIIVDGNIVRTLPHVAGDGQRYEDASYAYVFAGEEANVTAKAANKSTSCHQPVDPNNAPVNFGDAGEGGGAAARPEASAVVAELIAGKWQSTEDPNSVREFKAGGAVTDIYAGKAVSTDKWQTFTKEKLPKVKVGFPVEANAVYVQISSTGSEADTLNFKVGKLTPEELELVYMERGNTLSYKKVQ